MIAADLLGPKALKPAASKASTAPAANGSSGATTTKSMFFSFAIRNIITFKKTINLIYTYFFVIII